MNTDISNILKEALGFWDNLSQDDKQLIIDNTTSVKHKKGTNIFSPHLDCLGVVIIKSGELRTYILSSEGRDVTLFRLNTGDSCVLSASCILKSIDFDVFIDAEKDSELLIINPIIFSKILEHNVYAENFALKLSVDRFSRVMWAMQQILFASFDSRLATFLCKEMEHLNSKEIKLTHEQIAKYMGSAREVVSRMLKEFEEEGILELHRGGLKILDEKALRSYIID